MKDTLAEINELRTAGHIGKWAIGGAMGATFYLEPISTYDLDIFVIFEGAPLILTLTPIYDFLKARGHTADGDAVMVHGWPVHRKEPRTKLDGWAEAHLVVAACSPPPEGASRWTLKLLGDHLVRLQLVESLSAQTVGRTLKKTR